MVNILPKNINSIDHFGLSLSPTALRAVRLNQNQEFQSSVKIDLHPEDLENGQVNSANLEAALTKLLQTNPEFAQSYVAATLPDQESFSRTHKIPKIPLNEVSEALNWQIESIFPLSKDQIYFDWKLVEQDKDSLTVLIVAIPKSTIDTLIAVLEKTGLKPVCFEPEASTLARTMPPSTAPKIIVEINYTYSTTSIIDNNTSSLTLTNQYEPVVAPEAFPNIVKTIIRSVQSLINNINTKNPETSQSLQIFLTGEMASLELAQNLKQLLGYPVEVLNLKSIPPEFHSAYAAAASAIRPPQDYETINLLPKMVQDTYEAQKSHQQITGRTIFALIFFIIFFFVALSISAFTYFNLITIKNTKNKLTTAAPVPTYNLDEVNYLNRAANNLVTLFPRKTTPVNLLDKILKVKPENISLKTINYDKDKNKITLSGMAADREVLLSYRDELKKTNLFTDISFPLDTLQKSTQNDFSINLIIKNTQPKP
jgi:Tfp pilus assembly PilM family ATPase